MDTVYKWYVVYTKSRSEKKTEELLNSFGIETYLPLIKTLRQWSDRKKKVEIPLISSYIFVKANISSYVRILQTDGVVSFIRFNGEPATIPEFQIKALKIFLDNSNIVPEINDNFIKGDEIEIKYGAFKGFRGEIVEKRGRQQLVVNILQLNLSVSLEISVENIIKV